MLTTLLLGLWFDAAYEQAPLYASNQATYLLHGLARAGRGALREDWMAQTLDPTPVFSRLVEWSYRLLPERAFFAEHAVLAGLYLLGLISIAEAWRGRARARSWSAGAVVAAALVVLHSRTAARMGSLGKEGYSHLFHHGVAYQDILGLAYQPNTFGVLLVVSIALFLRGRPLAAAAAAAIAATVHPTYLLPALALDLGYVIALLPRGQGARRAARLLIVSGALLLPIAVYALVTFRATSPEIQAAALRRLVYGRIPQHALPSVWFGPGACVRIGLVLAALVAARRSRLFPVLAAPFALAVVLTLVVVVHPDPWLSMLFPWRVSVVLVPVASTLLISVIARRLTAHRHGRAVAAAFLAASLVPCAIGGAAMAGTLAAPTQTKMTAFLAAARRPGQLYLIPPELPDFRIAVAAPVLVDRKTHPYKDVEILEWERRYALAARFYRRGRDCDVLDEITRTYGITDVLVPTVDTLLPCAGWEPIWEDKSYTVWEIPR